MSRAVTQRQVAREWPALPRARKPAARRRAEMLTDTLWRELSHHLVPSDADLAARHEARLAAEGVLWALRRGVAWRDLPAGLASPALVRRHWREWMRDGRWLEFWSAFVARLDGESWLGWSRALVRAGEELARSGSRQRDAAARYAWWVVSARLLLWGAGWIPGGVERVRRAG